MARKTSDHRRHGLELEEAIEIGARDWFRGEAGKLSKAWRAWMRRLGLQDITAADLDALARYFLLRESVRLMVHNQGLSSPEALIAFSRAEVRMNQLLRGLRLTRQAVDHDVLNKAQPRTEAPPAEGPPELTVTRRGEPHLG